MFSSDILPEQIALPRFLKNISPIGKLLRKYSTAKRQVAFLLTGVANVKERRNEWKGN
jgi:hypothetical protein